MQLHDTIIANSACADLGGGGGIRAIIRLSGPRAVELAGIVAALPEGAGAGHHGPMAIPLLHPRLPVASVLIFRGPRSFTGEDVAEIHLPNSPALIAACVDLLLEHGAGEARLAGPGEFSARAFFHGKIDLTEAEGIAATVNATSEMELRAATSLREGHLHQEIASFTDRLANVLAMVESEIDFTEEEDVHLIDAHKLLGELDRLSIGLHQCLAHAVRADRLDALPTVVFIGAPNVGKSSLINALAGAERSITSPVAGTTRDVLSVVISTPFGDVRLVDVPGEEPAVDELRKKMMAGREAALLEADLIIDVVADETLALSGPRAGENYGAETITVQNKADLLSPAERATFGNDERCERTTGREKFQLVSAHTGYNLDKLRHEIGTQAHARPVISQHLPALNQRHRALLQAAKEALNSDAASDFSMRHPELLAADLRRALDLLGQITGAISPDDVLGLIFSRFCIGK